MKRSIRGACALLLALALGFNMPALASAGGRFLRGGYTVEGDSLRMLCMELPEGGRLTATVGTQEAGASVSTVAEEDLPTTVYCLVDVSGSMSDAQMETAREAMLAISGEMGEDDNMVITSLGDTVDVGQLLDSSQSREEAINALSQGSADTNLYKGIVDSLELLDTSTKYNRNRCLVILSDGQDDHQTGSTEAEAMDAIKSSAIPIYAVATLPVGAGKEAQEYGKLLRSFATTSLGGAGYTPTLDEMTGEETGRAIWDSIQASGVVDIDLSGVKAPEGQDTLLVKVTYQTDDAEYVDTATVYAVDLPTSASKENGDDTEPSPEPGPDDDHKPEPESKGLPGWAIIAGAVLLAALIIAVVLIVKRKKKQEKPEEAQEEASEEPPEEPPESVPEEVPETAPVETVPETGPIESEAEAEAEPQGPDPWTPPPPVQADCRVRLTALGYPERVFDIDLITHQGMTLGRDDRAQTVLEGDSKLSGLHCELEWDGGAIYVRDRGSTNGSFVNGVPIQGKSWMPLEDGATLRIGAYEYRAKYTPRA